MLHGPCMYCGKIIELPRLNIKYCDDCRHLVKSFQARDSSHKRKGCVTIYPNCRSRLLEDEVKRK